jgi:hypothetical protein
VGLEGAEGVAEAGQARLPVGGEALDGLEDVLAVHVGLLDHIVLHATAMTRQRVKVSIATNMMVVKKMEKR